MRLVKEFKEFALRGSMVDMAVGIVIGAGFGKVVNSLVNDIIIPPLSVITGNIDFTEKALVLHEATDGAGAIVFRYGVFINTLVEFLIIAFSIFVVIKYMNKLKRKDDIEAPEQPTTKKCPFCFTNININALRCPQCTSDLKGEPLISK